MFSILVRQRTRIRKNSNIFHIVIPKTNQMNSHSRLQVGSTHVSIKGHTALTLFIVINQTWMSHIFMPIDQHVGMSVSPNKRPILYTIKTNKNSEGLAKGHKTKEVLRLWVCRSNDEGCSPNTQSHPRWAVCFSHTRVMFRRSHQSMKYVDHCVWMSAGIITMQCD